MRYLILSACLALPLPLPALAQDAATGGGAQAALTSAETCMRSATDPQDRTACLGQAAAQCIEAAGPANAAVRAECLGWERDYWQTGLDQTMGELVTALEVKDAAADGSVADAFRAAQDAWQMWRDAECGYAAERLDDATAASAAQASCEMALTGSRALQVEAELAAATQ